MTSRLLGTLILIAGSLLVIAALFADSLGWSGGGEGVGWKQLIAAIGGLILALVGLFWIIRPASA